MTVLPGLATRSVLRPSRRLASIGAVALALWLAGCASIYRGTEDPSPAPPQPKPVLLSEEPRDPEHSRIVAAYGGVYDNPRAARAIARAVGRLVAASDDPSVTYRITILDSPIINAFALPSGSLYVTRGLLALANDTSEVAAVIAHEMAHVTARHAFARARRGEAAQVVNRVVANVVQDPEQQRLAIASTQLSLARFSQVQELEADAIGVKTLARAGYDPFAAARFLTSMGRFANYRANRDATDRMDFLSSHPSTPERINFAVRAAREIGAPGIGEQDRDAYLSGIDGLTFGDDPAEGFVRGRSYLHRQLGIGFDVPEGWTIDNTPRAVLAAGRDGTALRFDGANVPPTLALDAYLKSGWINGLDPDSVATTTLAGLPAATGRATADGWSFRIAAVRVGPTTYRFILASRDPNEAFGQAFQSIIASFRQLTEADRASLSSLRLRLRTVAPGDTVASLARLMTGVDRPEELFRSLNGLAPDAQPEAGTTVKIVADK